MPVPLCQQLNTGAVGAALAEQSPAMPWDELSPDSHTQGSSRPAWSPKSATHCVSQKRSDSFHQSSHQSLQDNLTSLGLPAVGEGDRSARLEHRAELAGHQHLPIMKAMQKNEFLPGFVDEM